MTVNHYQRWQQQSLLDALTSRRVILLAGARQSGKTTLVRDLASLKKNTTIYRTLDNVALLEAALNDPHGFVKHNDELMIIDEVQRAPILLQAIKQDVDINQTPGRFLLTGSANIQSLPNVKESLAGRVRKIRLRPLSEGEIHAQPPQFIANAFNGKFSESSDYIKDDYLSLAFRGGYPETITLNEKERKRWHKDYLEALMERDLKDIANIKRKDSLEKLTDILAAWSSKLMDISAIGSHLALGREALELQINALETLFLTERIRCWSNTDYDRVSKRDKFFMTDTGLMTSILKWRLDDVRLDGEKNGKLIETFVFNQLAAILDAQQEDHSLYHYRDREKREVDFVVENNEGNILGIEVKAGSAITKQSFNHLIWLRDRIIKNKKFIGIVLYTGQHVASFGEHLWVVPISALWG